MTGEGLIVEPPQNYGTPTSMPPVSEEDKRKTEEELLANSNLSEEDRRRIKRRASNRESARRTRHKRTEKLKESEERSTALTEENDKISHQIRELEKLTYDAQLHNRAFKAEIAALRTAKPHLNALCPSTITRTPPLPDANQSLLNSTPPGFSTDLFSTGAHPPLPMSMTNDPHMFGMSTPTSLSLMGMPPPMSAEVPAGTYDPSSQGMQNQSLANVAPLTLGPMEGLLPPISVPGSMTGMLAGNDGNEQAHSATLHQMMVGIYQQSLKEKANELSEAPPGMVAPPPTTSVPAPPSMAPSIPVLAPPQEAGPALDATTLQQAEVKLEGVPPETQ